MDQSGPILGRGPEMSAGPGSSSGGGKQFQGSRRDPAYFTKTPGQQIIPFSLSAPILDIIPKFVHDFVFISNKAWFHLFV